MTRFADTYSPAGIAVAVSTSDEKMHALPAERTGKTACGISYEKGRETFTFYGTVYKTYLLAKPNTVYPLNLGRRRPKVCESCYKEVIANS